MTPTQAFEELVKHIEISMEHCGGGDSACPGLLDSFCPTITGRRIAKLLKNGELSDILITAEALAETQWVNEYPNGLAICGRDDVSATASLKIPHVGTIYASHIELDD